MIRLRHAPFVAAIMSAWWGLALPALAAGENPGHALAEKFAAEPEREAARRKTENDAKRRADEETEMLTRARAEAEQRKAAADKARAEAEARDQKEAESQRLAAEREEQERAEKARRLAEDQRIAREKFIAERTAEAERRMAAEEKRLADERRAAEEQRLADERRAAEDRRLAEQKAAEEKRLADERRAAEEQRLADERRAAEERRLAEQKAAEEKRLADERRVAEEQRLADERRVAEERRLAEQKAAEEKRLAYEARLRGLEAEREAEHRRLTDRLKTMERERMALGAPSAATADVGPQARGASRATVLLVMTSGTNGIRRFGKKTADPVLCAGPTCWISGGSDVTAKAVSRGLALGPGNTLGRRAAACNQHLACAFRDVDVAALASPVQPIDLRIMRHDRREPLKLEADATCRVASGTLACGKTFATRTWRAWVVPEHVAREAGVAVLDAAMASGLSMQPSAALTVR